MVDIADEVHAFWDGSSKGTKHTIKYAKEVGVPITIHRY